jgi:glycosyltransferase involved in cell wall biosynthesis
MKDLVKCWRELGYEVEHICGGDFSQVAGSSYAGTGNTQSPQKWYHKLKLLAPLKNSISEKRDIQNDIQIESSLEEMAGQNRPDIIWERSSRLHYAGLRVARKIGVPYVHEWIDNIGNYSFSLHHRKVVEIERYKNQQADYVVVVSEKIKADLINGGVDKNKILVAYNAVNPDEFYVDPVSRKEYRRELGIGSDEVLVGYLGNFSWYHDMTRLALAADVLKKKGETKIKVLMVGKGREYQKVYRLAEKLGLLDSMVIMKSWVPAETVPKVLSALDIAVLAGSTDIICPIKVQEYMAMELPTVLPDYPCNREVVTDGETGIRFEPKNEKTLAEKLLLLAKDSQLRGRLGKTARQEIIKRFTWEKTWGKALQKIAHSSRIS